MSSENSPGWIATSRISLSRNCLYKWGPSFPYRQTRSRGYADCSSDLWITFVELLTPSFSWLGGDTVEIDDISVSFWSSSFEGDTVEGSGMKIKDLPSI